MSNDTKESPFIKLAGEILETVHNSALDDQQRKEKAIKLATIILDEANATRSFKENLQQSQLARMMQDPRGKVFTTSMTDQCFRSKKHTRNVDQFLFLLGKYGIPHYFSIYKRCQLSLFRLFGKPFSLILGPLMNFAVRKETSNVILPGEMNQLKIHITKRREQKVRINLNQLGEAILGEEEAEKRAALYIKDLEQKEIEYISIKLSTIYSQINLLAWDKTLQKAAERLRRIYRAALQNNYTHPDGKTSPKFVNLDMEEYRDLHLTKDIFMMVLDEPEFSHYYAGIVLQAYLPDSFPIQKELIEWAKARVAKGGAPIKVRLVKGANLAMEQVEASAQKWHQAPYTNKSDVDANFKRMLLYGADPKNAKAVHLGIASHNLFDISYGMIIRAEKELEEFVTFEMLEGMADHIRRTVQKIIGNVLLYCPVAKKEDFQSAVAYLIRRLDENTAAENFLRHSFSINPGSKEWEDQKKRFENACDCMHKISETPRRIQNRLKEPAGAFLDQPFANESDTDFSLSQNREWAYKIIEKWQNIEIPNIPIVIGGEEIHQQQPQGIGYDPSNHDNHLYHFSYASKEQVDQTLNIAKNYESTWQNRPPKERAEYLSKAAHKLRENRADLIGAKLMDGGKTIAEGDPELSEAIDFAEYYARHLLELESFKDISWKAKGTILITPPWNFPVAIPAGGILASLVAGNCVIFKPAPEAVLSGWILVNTLWNAGIPKEALQFISCVDDPVGSQLIKDPRINAVILTGATQTAELFLKMRPDLDIAAETGGKNALIITALSDRDLAIKDLVQSAFGHSGQKCSAASLAILEAEVYDSPNFRKHLRDAAKSLSVGSAWDLSSKVVPLVREPSGDLLRGLTKLDQGEEWLLEPKCDPNNPNLWSPGIKLGVKEGSFMHQTELFGPVLGVMRAKNLEHAIKLANGTKYGLTSGIHSLDEREIKYWLENIEAGNLYINRGITGAIVQRQPFGGLKCSSFGHGSKAGGPNYLSQLMIPEQISLPKDKLPPHKKVNQLMVFLEDAEFDSETLGKWYACIANYAYHAQKLKEIEDPSLLIGQDNYLRFVPHKKQVLRIQENNSIFDILRVIAAALTCKASLDISYDKKSPLVIKDHHKTLFPSLDFIEESEEQFAHRVEKKVYRRVRLLSPPYPQLVLASGSSACYLNMTPVLSNGRFELLNYMREIAISHNYHRYGNLGDREGEKRSQVL